MKNLNETFEDLEFEEINSVKEKSNMTWRNFILYLIRKEKSGIWTLLKCRKCGKQSNDESDFTKDPKKLLCDDCFEKE